MFAAVDAALARLYPTARWGERDEAAALGEGISREEGEALAEAIGRKLGTLALFRPGDAEEWCDYIYVLCVGRRPSIIELREGVEPREGAGAAPDLDDDQLEDRYLRVALSALARFAGVQEVTMRLSRSGDEAVVSEGARSGVFDPGLLRRFQSLVAVLAEWNVVHLDFGEIVEPPPGFDARDYTERFGAEPVIANYLFYPQPPTTISTVALDLSPSPPVPIASA